ncbi:MAG: hypothetical protein O2960_04140 [Verrucomicrobia bacterium]|nr:hypothetical protein [Verrucomicrobiota bacterium]
MKTEGDSEFVERLFPFVLRSRCLIVGRETLQRSRSRLHFILITEDLSASSQSEILSEFAPYPIVKCYTSSDLERFFEVTGTKVIGFKKSGLAQSIYAELKAFRINRHVERAQDAAAPTSKSREE